MIDFLEFKIIYIGKATLLCTRHAKIRLSLRPPYRNKYKIGIYNIILLYLYNIIIIAKIYK